MKDVILIQSHDWGNDVSTEDYKPLVPFPVKVTGVYENMVTGYCGGGDHPAVGQVVKTASELMEAVGKPGGYQHCRLEIAVTRQPHLTTE